MMSKCTSLFAKCMRGGVSVHMVNVTISRMTANPRIVELIPADHSALH